MSTTIDLSTWTLEQLEHRLTQLACCSKPTAYRIIMLEYYKRLSETKPPVCQSPP